MRLFRMLRSKKQFMLPEHLNSARKGNLRVNSDAISSFLKLNAAFNESDMVLDFGCGNGETTAAIAKGDFSENKPPEKVIGVDISEEMIQHCSANYSIPGLSFKQLDYRSRNGEVFGSVNAAKFSVITSFSTLHWVSDQPAVLAFFNRLLRIGGKFLFVIASGHSGQDPHRAVYQDMKQEPEWSEHLASSRWPYFNIAHENSEWMTTLHPDGRGKIIKEDYSKLLAKMGFRVQSAEPNEFNIVVGQDFSDKFFRATVGNAFPEIQGEARDRFFGDYLKRIKSHPANTALESEGSAAHHILGFTVFGEKMSNIDDL